MDSSTLFSLRLSLQVAVTATILMVLFGIPISYLLARKSFRGRDIIDILLTLPLVLPPTVTGYYTANWCKLRFLDNYFIA